MRLYYITPSQASTVHHKVGIAILSPELQSSMEVGLLATKIHWLSYSTSISTFCVSPNASFRITSEASV
ncbi:unnamed protein product [Brassica oleracea]